MNRSWRVWVCCLVVGVLVGLVWSCRPDPKNITEQQLDGAVDEGQKEESVKFTESGVTYIDLREAASSGLKEEGTGVLRTVAANGLEEARLKDIYRRLPALVAEEDDAAEFLRRVGSKPRPRTGETVVGEFPPASERAKPVVDVPAGPLEVVRFQPEGEVAGAPRVSVTFSQPMVAVTSHAETVAKGVPVELNPQPAGTWRWIGTKTLLFEPSADAFAMATEYMLRVPAGTKSAVKNGGVLAKDFVGTFATAPLEVVRMYPEGGPSGLEPVIFLEFNQKVQKEALLKHVQVRMNGAVQEIRLARADEIEADSVVSRLVQSAKAESWLAIRAKKAFEPKQSIDVTVMKGAVSAEGPRVTEKAQTRKFATYGDFHLVRSHCGWADECRPEDEFQLQFSNPLDVEQDLDALIQIEPEIKDLTIAGYSQQLTIMGRKQGRTRYTVRVSGALQDSFGQKLGEDKEVTFEVGESEPYVLQGDSPMVVLDPAGKPTYSVYTMNWKEIRVKGYRVTPEDWPQYLEHMAWNSKTPMPGMLVFEKVIEPQGEPDRLTETVIDLLPALGRDGLGHMVLVVDPANSRDDEEDNDDDYRRGYWEQPAKYWIQSTRIGLDGYADSSGLHVWATSLEDGTALEGVEIVVGGQGSVVKTGANGLVSVAAEQVVEKNAYLLAKKGADTALLSGDFYGYRNGVARWHLPQVQDQVRWYVLDDRKMYKPGESVRIKGWTRLIEGGPAGDVELVKGAKQVTFAVRDARGVEFAKGKAAVSETGGFDFKVEIPDGANLGYAYAELVLDKGPEYSNRHTHAFQIQEFRRPEFEVSARVEEGPHFLGEDVKASVEAAYYAGGALGDAAVSWQVISRQGRYAPPNRSEYEFGRWVPWWWGGIASYGRPGGEEVSNLAGKTDMAGEHTIAMGFRSFEEPLPLSVEAVAGVQDVNRQTWQARTSLLVHPADVYVGLRDDEMFVEQGKPFELGVIVTDLEGRLVAGRDVEVVSHRLKWTYSRGDWKQEAVDAQRCVIVSKEEETLCSLKTTEGGTYRIRAVVKDAQGRKNLTELTRWVAGGEDKPARGVEEEELLLIADKQEYAIGDVAEILVQAPFYPAEGLVTYSRDGIVRQERITVDKPGTVVKVEMLEAYLPNLHVRIDLNGEAPRRDAAGKVDETLPKRVAFATGQVNLSLSKETRRLVVEVTPGEKASSPGSPADVEVVVRDHAGEAVADSDLLVFVVDEAVLALSNYTLADPLEVFYGDRADIVNVYRSRGYVLLADPDTMEAMEGDGDRFESGHGGMAAGGGVREKRMAMAAPIMESAVAMDNVADDGGDAIALRENFDALAAFEPTLRTDASGRAKISFQLPDNLTRYRVMAVAFSGKHDFGTGESNMIARLPLMVRASAPRFLNFGDQFELPVVVQNQTDAAMEVDVAVRGTNIAFVGGASKTEAGAKVTVPAQDRVEVRFKTKTENAGTARFQVGVSSGTGDAAVSDAMQFTVPVWTPATTEAFATYGEVDTSDVVVQSVVMPGGVFEQFGGLELTTSSTELQALTDAFISLMNYPFNFAEQIASRMLAIAALRDVLTAFEAEGMPSKEEIAEAMARDLEILEQLQHRDGGFGYWTRDEKSYPYVSVHVAHGLRRAKNMGFAVPERLLTRSEQYLENIEKHVPEIYGPKAKNAVVAYALYVRDVGGKPDLAATRALFARENLEDLTLEARGWILAVLARDPQFEAGRKVILRDLNNRVQETAATAQFGSDYGDSAWYMLYTSRRTDGVLLDALIAANPQSDLIPKLVRGLLAHRSKGQWGTTQDNVFALLALERYFKVFEKETPDFVASAWLGEQFVGEQRFKGRTTERQHVDVPMAYLAAERDGGQDEAIDFALQKEGKGRMYYRLGMRYAPKSLVLEPADHGFAVERVYEAVDHPEDVKQRKDGVWEVRAGARVKVTVTMATPARRYHVALVDMLPAGFEPLNPALAVTTLPADAGAMNGGRGGYSWWWGPWYEHQNMRDERVEAFSSLVWGGVQTYTYYARATTPGEFVVPPAKAEEMYHPETFGRSGSDRVIVK